MWLPLVMTSAPRPLISSRISFVTPNPEAAFSTFTITKSMPMEETISGRRSFTARRPGDPKTSATKSRFTRRGSLRVLHGARLPDHDDLDLAGILELPLHTARHVARELRRPRVVDVLRLDHDAHLAARLDGVGLLHPGERVGDLLERLEALDVVLDALPPRARARARDRVGRHDEHGVEVLGRRVVVVVAHRLHDLRRLAILGAEVHGDLRVRALHLVRHGLPQVVEEPRALRQLDVEAELRRHHPADPGDFLRMLENVLAVGRAVLEPAQELHDLRVHAVDAHLEDRGVAQLDDLLVDLLLDLRDDLLD